MKIIYLLKKIVFGPGKLLGVSRNGPQLDRSQEEKPVFLRYQKKKEIVVQKRLLDETLNLALFTQLISPNYLKGFSFFPSFHVLRELAKSAITSKHN